MDVAFFRLGPLSFGPMIPTSDLFSISSSLAISLIEQNLGEYNPITLRHTSSILQAAAFKQPTVTILMIATSWKSDTQSGR